MIPNDQTSRIPTHIITGFLGVGKTTAIQSLLSCRPANERWGIFVNEYGMVAIDQLLLDDQHPQVQIQELAGGCFCCSTSQYLKPALTQFIRNIGLDRCHRDGSSVDQQRLRCARIGRNGGRMF